MQQYAVITKRCPSVESCYTSDRSKWNCKIDQKSKIWKSFRTQWTHKGWPYDRCWANDSLSLIRIQPISHTKQTTCRLEKANVAPYTSLDLGNLSRTIDRYLSQVFHVRYEEHIVLRKMLQKVDKVLNNRQHGFRKGLSCETRRAFWKQLTTIIVYMQLSSISIRLLIGHHTPCLWKNYLFLPHQVSLKDQSSAQCYF